MAATTKKSAAQKAAEEAARLGVKIKRVMPKRGRGEIVARPGK